MKNAKFSCMGKFDVLLSNKFFCCALFLIISFVFVLFFETAVSPIFVAQGSDSSVYKLMGLAILKGKVPYKDLFDHKGPVMYFIQAFAQIIAPGRYGIFSLRTVSLTICTLFWFEISKLFLNPKRSLLVVLLTLFAYYSIESMYGFSSGNLTEDWSVLFITISFYCEVILLSSFSNKVQCNRSKLITIGLCFACCFLIRPNDAAAFIGGPIVGLLWTLVEHKRSKDIGMVIAYIALGAMIVCVPTVMYFYVNSALSDFWYGLIGYNTMYTGDIRFVLLECFSVNKYQYLPILLTICVLAWYVQKPMLRLIIPTYILCYVLLGSRCYEHYFIAWIPMVFLVFWMLLFDNKNHNGIIVLSLFLFFAQPFYYGRNILKIPYRMYSDYEIYKKRVPREIEFYKRSSCVFEEVEDMDSVWSYNLTWNDSTNTFSILWMNDVVPCNRIPLVFLANVDDNLSKYMDITAYNPKYILVSKDDDMLSTYSECDSVFIAEKYKCISKCVRPNLEMYERK